GGGARHAPPRQPVGTGRLRDRVRAGPREPHMSAIAPAREQVVAAEPRVQLLPPSVRQRERMREARRLMTLLVLLAVTIVGGGMTWAYFRQAQEQIALEAATARTDQLLAEQAEYAEASHLASLVEATLDAQRTVTANE